MGFTEEVSLAGVADYVSGLWSWVPERALYLKDNNMKSYGSPGQWECCKEFSSVGV